MIIVLAGKRVGAPVAEIRRFPVKNIELVRQRLRELFGESEPIQAFLRAGLRQSKTHAFCPGPA